MGKLSKRKKEVCINCHLKSHNDPRQRIKLAMDAGLKGILCDLCDPLFRPQRIKLAMDAGLKGILCDLCDLCGVWGLECFLAARISKV